MLFLFGSLSSPSNPPVTPTRPAVAPPPSRTVEWPSPPRLPTPSQPPLNQTQIAKKLEAILERHGATAKEPPPVTTEPSRSSAEQGSLIPPVTASPPRTTDGSPAEAPPVEILPPPVANSQPAVQTDVPERVVAKLDPTLMGDARQIQQRLIDLGFLLGTADGIWGPRSGKALEEFRIAEGIGDGATWDYDTEQRLLRAPMATSQGANFVGGWGLDTNQCKQSNLGKAPLTITARRAEAFGGVCEFSSVQPDSPNTWNINATCIHDGERWRAAIRLSVAGNTLTWSSERGTTRYVRCLSR